MTGRELRTRYGAAQLVEAIDDARGDGRYFLVEALINLPGSEREAALVTVVDKDLRPDERAYVLAELVRIDPAAYLEGFVAGGLRSRSINVQHITMMTLAAVADFGLGDELCAQVEDWLRRRLANPRRKSTWDPSEIPAAALVLLPSYGTTRVSAVLDSLENRFQPEEKRRWKLLRRFNDDQQTFTRELQAWRGQTYFEALDDEARDPTAEVSVDRVMRRLGFRPENPESKVYDPLADFDVPQIEIDAREGHLGPPSIERIRGEP